MTNGKGKKNPRDAYPNHKDIGEEMRSTVQDAPPSLKGRYKYTPPINGNQKFDHLQLHD